MISHVPETVASKVSSSEERSGRGKSKTRVILGLMVAAVSIVAIVALLVLLNKSKPESNLELSGRIEAPESRISTTMPGRVQSVAVREGDSVYKGQPLISLDNQAVVAKERAAQSGVSLARRAEIEAGAQARALASAARKTAPRGVFGKMLGGVTGRTAKAQKLSFEAEHAQSEARIAQAQVAKAEATRQAVSANLDSFKVTSPIDGVCATRAVEPGDVVAPGQVLLTIADLNHAYFRGFMPEAELAKVSIGQRATVTLDAAPSTPLSARVTSIDTEPSFTPENIYFKEDKVKQVFGVELAIEHPGGIAKPGMSAEAVLVPANKRRL